jgi:hypothetical protein
MAWNPIAGSLHSTANMFVEESMEKNADGMMFVRQGKVTSTSSPSSRIDNDPRAGACCEIPVAYASRLRTPVPIRIIRPPPLIHGDLQLVGPFLKRLIRGSATRHGGVRQLEMVREIARTLSVVTQRAHVKQVLEVACRIVGDGQGAGRCAPEIDVGVSVPCEGVDGNAAARSIEDHRGLVPAELARCR